MTEQGPAKDSKPQPVFSNRGERQAELRRQRQAEALRANLMRRKEQSRSRVEGQDDTPAPENEI